VRSPVRYTTADASPGSVIVIARAAAARTAVTRLDFSILIFLFLFYPARIFPRTAGGSLVSAALLPFDIGIVHLFCRKRIFLLACYLPENCFLLRAAAAGVLFGLRRAGKEVLKVMSLLKCRSIGLSPDIRALLRLSSVS